MINAAANHKTVLLTGASRGIGHATAQNFEKQGWRVITVSRTALDGKCPWSSGASDHIQADLADIQAYPALISSIRSRLGGSGLHAIVCNAGISPKNGEGQRLGACETDFEQWMTVFNVNFFSCAVLSRGLLPELQATGGSIVNVTSIAGTRVHPFAGGAYACSKAALSSLTRELAHDLGPFGIRVNAVSPGEIDTAILSIGTQAIVDNQIPMKRLGSPEEVAQTILFLCSKEASYINGAEIQIDGGQHV